jgi:hypothetical protein
MDIDVRGYPGTIHVLLFLFDSAAVPIPCSGRISNQIFGTSACQETLIVQGLWLLAISEIFSRCPDV